MVDGMGTHEVQDAFCQPNYMMLVLILVPDKQIAEMMLDLASCQAGSCYCLVRGQSSVKRRLLMSNLLVILVGEQCTVMQGKAAQPSSEEILVVSKEMMIISAHQIRCTSALFRRTSCPTASR